MILHILHDKAEIEKYLSKNILLNIYSIGDLDDFFWNYTTWYAAKEDDEIQSLILSYAAPNMPTFIAVSDDNSKMAGLLSSILHLLPRRFYAHLNGGLSDLFAGKYLLEPHGLHYKMGLSKSDYIGLPSSAAARLSADNLEDIYKLYRESYPGNWFDERMLQTRQYYGMYVDGELVSIGGIHVYSEKYRVSAVGNVATNRAHRKQGYGRQVMTKLCNELFKVVDYIGLNVKADNESAIALYQKLGFRKIGEYEEYVIDSRE